MTKEQQVIPIYGAHRTFTGNKYEGQAYASVIRQHIFPEDISFWPNRALRRVQRLNPSIIAIDSVSANESFLKLSYNPGNPFSLKGQTIQEKDLFIVGGDVIASPLRYTSPFEIPDKITELERKALARYSSGSILMKAITRALPEIGTMFGLDLLTRVPSNTFINSVALLAFVVECMRIYSKFVIPYNAPSLVRRLTYPIGVASTELNFRNAILTAKTLDAKNELGEEVADGPAVVLVGSAHEFSKNVWRREDKREQAMEKMFTKIFTKIKRLAKRKDITLTEEEIQKITSDIAKLFSLTAIWKVKEKPKDMRVKQVERRFFQERSFYSPTVQQAAYISAQKVFDNIIGNS